MYCVWLECPGTQSSEAGKVAACAGCPNQPLCASSRTLTAPDPGSVSWVTMSVKIDNIVLVSSCSSGEGEDG